MANRQLTKWDAKVHEDILIALFQHSTVAPAQWSKVMDDLQLKGYSFTENALRYGLSQLCLTFHSVPFFFLLHIYFCSVLPLLSTRTSSPQHLSPRLRSRTLPPLITITHLSVFSYLHFIPTFHLLHHVCKGSRLG